MWPFGKKVKKLMLLDVGAKKVNCIKALRSITGLGLQACLDIANNLGVVCTNEELPNLEGALRELQQAGAIAKIK